MDMIDIETDFVFSSENIFNVISGINRCNACSIAENRTSEIPFPPEYLLPINEIKFGLIHQSPMIEDTLESGFFNKSQKYGKIFDKFLNCLGLSREEMYISASVFCCLQSKRYPVSTDYFLCLKHKYEEFKCLGGLKCLFLMGDISLKQILDITFSINEYDKEIFLMHQGDKKVFVVPIQHVFQYMQKSDEEWQKSVIQRLYEIRDQIVIPIKNGML